MLLIIAQEMGNECYGELQAELADEEAPKDDASLIEAVAKLHARACRTCAEVICLLRGGFADGANARWRSLHELGVTAMFLAQHQGEVARRYLDHPIIEQSKAAQQYQAHCHTLGYEPASEEELNQLRVAAKQAVDRYGKSFETDYGWAAAVLRHSRPTFADIEASLDMQHWRPFYKLACQSVHGGSRALEISLSAPFGFDEFLLADASDAGLCDPGHCAAISLMMASVAFFTLRPNLDSLVTCRCMQKLCDDIGKAFDDAQEDDESQWSPFLRRVPPVDRPC
jgi:hypothetical protein